MVNGLYIECGMLNMWYHESQLCKECITADVVTVKGIKMNVAANG